MEGRAEGVDTLWIRALSAALCGAGQVRSVWKGAVDVGGRAPRRDCRSVVTELSEGTERRGVHSHHYGVNLSLALGARGERGGDANYVISRAMLKRFDG